MIQAAVELHFPARSEVFKGNFLDHFGTSFRMVLSRKIWSPLKSGPAGPNIAVIYGRTPSPTVPT